RQGVLCWWRERHQPQRLREPVLCLMGHHYTGRRGSAGNKDVSFFLPRGHIDGFILSNGTDATNDIDISAGWCVDSSRTVSIESTATIVKRADATWAVGTGNGGLASGAGAFADGTTHHIYVIKHANGTVDAGFDDSTTAANLISDSGYSWYRRVGSVLATTGPAWRGFVQHADQFQYLVPFTESPDVSGMTLQTLTLKIPTGFVHEASLLAGLDDSADTYVWLHALNITDTATTATLSTTMVITGTASVGSGGQVRVWTNASAQIGTRRGGSTPSTFRLATAGWRDLRGKDA
ncbi:MAG TPA: hypothetical protein VMX57_09040, partial [Planctomycetota bacterium]|nr:hypothetical protein [Planctomycetota bacterium]